MASGSVQKRVSTYTRSAAKDCLVFTPEDTVGLAELMHGLAAQGRPYALMGGGNSFGDVFLPSRIAVIDTTAIADRLEIDAVTGRVHVSAGVRSGVLAERLLTEGLYLPGASGSLTNTVAGDLSSDVNGKDSWKHGNFGTNAVSIDLITADGERMTVTKEDETLFRGIIGGLGMLGVITGVTLQARKTESAHLSVERIATGNLRETLRVFSELDGECQDFAYAWVDTLCGKAYRGRAVVELARFERDEPGATRRPNIFEPRGSILGLPDGLFWGLTGGAFRTMASIGLSRPMSAALNSARYALARMNGSKRSGVPLAEFQYPMLKALPNWNKGISPQGFQELQLLFSADVFEQAFLSVLSILDSHGVFPLICAIRRHRGGGGMLSFCGDGLSFTVNYDRSSLRDAQQCYRMEREIMAATIKWAGKAYLSKFPYVTPDEYAAMYPESGSFRSWKERLDPKGLLMSAAAARLLG